MKIKHETGVLVVSQCLYKHTWRSLESWNVPQKWLCYSRQDHGIVHLNCRAHTAVTEFWVVGMGAGCWHWYSKTVRSRKHEAERLLSSFSRFSLRDVHDFGQFSFTLNLQRVLPFGSLGVLRLNTDLRILGKPSTWPSFLFCRTFSSGFYQVCAMFDF